MKKFDENYNHLESESLEVVAHSELSHDSTSITPCSNDRERHVSSRVHVSSLPDTFLPLARIVEKTCS